MINYITLPVGEKKVKHILPRGFCLDRSASGISSLEESLVITNCIAVRNADRPYYSRRPVDTVIDITFTQLRVPEKTTSQKYLSVISKKMDFQDFFIPETNKRIIYGKKKLQKNFFYINIQKIGSSKDREFLRKYFFLVDKKLTIMTILSFEKPSKNIYPSFESFIKKLSQSNS